MSTSTFRIYVFRSKALWPALEQLQPKNVQGELYLTDAIEIIDVPVVEPGPGEARVGIAAAPVNPVDLATAGGRPASVARSSTSYCR